MGLPQLILCLQLADEGTVSWNVIKHQQVYFLGDKPEYCFELFTNKEFAFLYSQESQTKLGFSFLSPKFWRIQWSFSILAEHFGVDWEFIMKIKIHFKGAVDS